MRSNNTSFSTKTHGLADGRTDTSYAIRRPHLTEHAGQIIPATDDAGQDAMDSWRQQLCQAVGIPDLPLVAHVLEQTIKVVPSGSGTSGVDADAVLAALCELNGLFGQVLLLKAQMVACHHHAMTLMAKATRTASDMATHEHLKLATKLMGAYAGHMSLLDKLLKGGNQTMTVRHVHVHDGGQAIVGCVRGGGGS